MKEKFESLVNSLSETEADNIITLLTHLLESWEDDKINLHTSIQDFELSTIYKVLNLFTNERENQESVIEPE